MRCCRATIIVLGVLAALARPGSAAELQLGDIVLVHDPDSFADPVVFSHWVHRLRFTCNACHPGLFSMTESATITHDEMLEGRSCGACHTGRVAFPVNPTTCNHCHVPVEP